MKDADAIIDDMNIHFEDISLNWLPQKENVYDMEKDQPQHFSWLHVWASRGGLAADCTVAVTYKDAEEFQQEVVNTVSRFFNTDALKYIMNGRLTMFGMQIGPEQPSGGNINHELGLEVSSE